MQAHSGCRQNSVPCFCRTKVLILARHLSSFGHLHSFLCCFLHLQTNNSTVNLFCISIFSPLFFSFPLLEAGESSLLLKTCLIRSDEFLPTTKTPFKFHHLQKTLDVHSFTSSSSTLFTPYLQRCPFSTSPASYSKLKHHHTAPHFLFAGLTF